MIRGGETNSFLVSPAITLYVTSMTLSPPTRSALYVPADNTRAMEKAASLAADAFIFDLEDGVAPERKASARGALANIDTPINSLKIVRINHRSTPYYESDIAAIASLPINAMMLSKVSDISDIHDAITQLARHDRADIAIWCNIETPRGVLNVREIAAHPSVAALVAGTNDLANDLRVVRTPDRLGLLHALQEMVLAARAYGKIALDGTFINLTDSAGLEAETKQGRTLGFDGKTLIHPSQIEVANRIFSPSEDELAHARAIIAAYEAAMAENKAVTLLNGQMIERLHYDRSKALL